MEHFSSYLLSKRIVLTKREVFRIFDHLNGTRLLIAQLIYGCGLRLMEYLRLRVKDIDFERPALRSDPGRAIKTGRPSCLKALRMISGSIWIKLEICLERTAWIKLQASNCMRPWSENIQMLERSGHGNGYFRFATHFRLKRGGR